MPAERRTDRDDQEDVADVRACLAGDGEAFSRLIRRHEQAIAAQMWRFTRDRQELEELVQDVFVEAYRSLATYRGRAPLRHWLRRIATRTGYRRWKLRDVRRRQREALESMAAELVPQTAPDEPAEAAEVLHDLLALLPAEDRLVLDLQYFEDLGTREIAERTGWSRTLVKVRAFRARRRLRGLLERAGFGREDDHERDD